MNLRPPWNQLVKPRIGKFFSLRKQTVNILDFAEQGQNKRYYVGISITREKTNFHIYFVDEIKNLIVIIE